MPSSTRADRVRSGDRCMIGIKGMDNINRVNTVKCTVIRLGLVKAVQEQSVIIEVNGKSVAIARDKIAAGAEVGHEVRWDGQMWVVPAGQDQPDFGQIRG